MVAFEDLIIPLNFIIVEGFLFDVIIGYITLEDLSGTLDLRKCVEYFTRNINAVRIPLVPKYKNLKEVYEETDRDYFTSSSSATPSSLEVEFEEDG